jgi:phenylacetate-CoA ligase
VDENNNLISQPGIEGRIIATGFDNKIMPFIRYDTGDIGILSENVQCECGFYGSTLEKITGRSQSIIVLTDGTKVSLTSFIFGQHLDAFGRILEMQIIQEKIGEIEIKILKGNQFTENDEHSLLSKLRSSVNNKIQINISYVDELPKTSRGKSRFFISKLDP